MNNTILQRIHALEKKVESMGLVIGTQQTITESIRHKKHKKHQFKRVCGECGKTYKGNMGIAIHYARTHKGVRVPITLLDGGKIGA